MSKYICPVGAFFKGIRTYEEDERASPATAGAGDAPLEKGVCTKQRRLAYVF